jgi:CMP-2-keto-3-deoxyoctulosonic acid synthetase
VQGAARAASAGFVKNPKLNRYEDLKNRLTKLLEQEKKNLRYVRTMCAAGIDTRNHLERVLR